MSSLRRLLVAFGLLVGLVAAVMPVSVAQDGAPEMRKPRPHAARVVQYNVLDIRTEDVKRDDNPRLIEIAATIQRNKPDIVLINEITYDYQGAPYVEAGEGEGQNARRFVENYLMKAQEPGLQPLRYEAFMAPSNTGVPSGHDFNNSGVAVTEYPPPIPGDPDGTPGPQTPEGQQFGEDAFGFGIFPGQYAMAVLVHPKFEVLEDEVRTFQLFRWMDMPGALLPVDPATGESWYSPEELEVFRLSSKSHWDVPVRSPAGEVVHLLASHPTPRGFDGPEDRNGRRNHDEVRFWADYLDDADYIYDDEGTFGGLDPDASFVVMGDLNNTSDVAELILDHDRVNGEFVPLAITPDANRSPQSTGGSSRIDYVVPSTDLGVVDGWVYGHRVLYDGGTYEGRPSDHYPVSIDITGLWPPRRP